MQFGFMSTTSAAMPIRKQIAAMRAAGFELDGDYSPVFRDNRAHAIAALEPGDVLVVASAACLGTVANDVLRALRDLGARGASVLDLSTGKNLQWSEETQIVLEFAERADHDNRVASISRMRKARAASGNLGGKAPVDWDTLMPKLKQGLKDGLSREALAKKLGVSRSSLQRKLREMDTSKKGAEDEA